MPKVILDKRFLLIVLAILVTAAIIVLLLLPKTKSATPSKSKLPVNPAPTSSTSSSANQYGDTSDATAGNFDTSAGFIEIFTPNQKIARIGEETIYGADLNRIINAKYPKDTIAKAPPEEIKKRSLDDTAEESILLQEEKKLGNIDLVSPVFDSENKNFILRNKLVGDIKTKRIAAEEKISGAFISIWYHNVRLPSITLTQSQELAMTKISRIYDSLKSGKITFEAAGRQIKNDTALSKIDKNYRGNAYYEFSDKSPSEEVFVYPDLQNILWSLDSGEMSAVIQHPQGDVPLGQQEEEFYGIIKVTNRINKGAGSYEDWIEKTKKSYEIQVY